MYSPTVSLRHMQLMDSERRVHRDWRRRGCSLHLAGLSRSLDVLDRLDGMYLVRRRVAERRSEPVALTSPAAGADAIFAAAVAFFVDRAVMRSRPNVALRDLGSQALEDLDSLAICTVVGGVRLWCR